LDGGILVAVTPQHDTHNVHRQPDDAIQTEKEGLVIAHRLGPKETIPIIQTPE
jgi:hypothetical protein